MRSPQDHAGVVHNSNLCTEILLNTSQRRGRRLQPRLGQPRRPRHGRRARPRAAARRRCTTAMRMLDNVIDLNHYPIPEARTSNLRHRPVGLGSDGVPGCALHARHRLRLGSGGRLRRRAAWRRSAYYAILASTELAAERGRYPSYRGLEVGPRAAADRHGARCWPRSAARRSTSTARRRSTGNRCASAVRDARACATATAWPSRRRRRSPTSRGSAQSIEPLYTNLYVKSNISGEFTVVNEHLVRDLKRARAVGRGDARRPQVLRRLACGRSTAIPDDLKERYPTAFEIDASWLVDSAARRQKWIDMGQSLNLYVAEPSGRQLDALYRWPGEQGLRRPTTCARRRRPRPRNRRSTSTDGKLKPCWMRARSASAGPRSDRDDEPPACKAAACRIDDPGLRSAASTAHPVRRIDSTTKHRSGDHRGVSTGPSTPMRPHCHDPLRRSARRGRGVRTHRHADTDRHPRDATRLSAQIDRGCTRRVDASTTSG